MQMKCRFKFTKWTKFCHWKFFKRIENIWKEKYNHTGSVFGWYLAGLIPTRRSKIRLIVRDCLERLSLGWKQLRANISTLALRSLTIERSARTTSILDVVSKFWNRWMLITSLTLIWWKQYKFTFATLSKTLVNAAPRHQVILNVFSRLLGKCTQSVHVCSLMSWK